LLPDRTSPHVAVSVSYKVGQRDDPRGYGGLAHLTEHLMFQKTRHVREGGLPRTLDRIGAVERMGATSLDHTTYWEVVPSHQLEAALWLESERMAFMLDGLDQPTLDRQRHVVLREHEERGRKTLGNIIHHVAKTRLFPPEHPYHDYGDDPVDLRAMELDHVRWLFQRFYRPDNARLAIVGDFDPPAARAIIERSFGPITAHSAPIESAEPALPAISKAERRVTYGWRNKSAHLALLWRTPASLASGDVELDLLARVLADGP
jgi:zinc protease